MDIKQRLKALLLLEDIQAGIITALGFDPHQEPQLFSQISDIVAIVGKDRDGNNTFDFRDLQILFSDLGAMVSLCGSLLGVAVKIPGLISKRSNPESVEELVLKLLVYTFLVILPKEKKVKLTLDQKEKILDICLGAYQMIKQLNIVQGLTKSFFGYMKSGCCKKPKTDKLDLKLQEHNIDLQIAVSRATLERRLMDQELKAVERTDRKKVTYISRSSLKE
jgi:hypothetical protein